MNITINNKHYQLPDNLTVVQVLESVGRPISGIAVAIDGTVVPAAELAEKIVTDGNSLMVIKAFYGG